MLDVKNKCIFESAYPNKKDTCISKYIRLLLRIRMI